MHKLSNLAKEKSLFILMIFALILSVASFVYFYLDQQLHLSFGDAISRLDITRKIIDNLNPGLAQIGSVWLPLPFLLMLPFIGDNFLWHSGIAGYIVSGGSFIFTVYFLYKLGIEAFRKKSVAFLMAIVALSSVNFLFVQTTAMSEPLFMLTTTGATYYLFKWAKHGMIPDLLLSAFFISAGSFTRYEGYFVFLFSLVLILIISFLKRSTRQKTEGVLFLFATLAVTGIVAWCLYNWVIFGNPLYWKDIYLGKASIISTEELVKIQPTTSALHSDFLPKVISGFQRYWTAVLETNGVIISVLAFLGLITFSIHLLIRKNFIKRPEYLALFLPLGIAAFTLFALFGGFPLDIPPLTWENLLTKSTNTIGEYNLVYGLLMLPLVAIVLGYLSSFNKYFFTGVVLILFLQLITTFIGPYFTVYQFSEYFRSDRNADNNGHNAASVWLKQHYDGGEILISAQNHNPEMFFLGLDIKKYIHEGAGKYWLESRDNPQRYVTWIYMFSPGVSGDEAVTKHMINNPNLNTYFNQVYNDGRYQIYRIKDRPEVEIK